MVRPAVPLPVSIVFAMLGCGLAAPFARAQEVTVSAAATTPIRVWTWTYWGTLLSSTQPAGPLPTSGAVSNIVFGAKAAVAWELPDATSFDLTFDCGAQGGSTSQFGVDAFGLVLDLAAPSSRAVVLEFSRVDTVTGVCPLPVIAIDVGNDGSVEYLDVPAAGPLLVPAVAGPGPLQVALSMPALTLGQSSFGTLHSDVRVRVLPDNDVIISKTADGCVAGQPGFDEPVPVFADLGVDLRFTPGLLVFGLQSAPTMWTPASVLPFVGQCLIVPAPELLLGAPGGEVHVALPPAVRPVTFHAQVVFLTGGGLGATDAYMVVAN